MLSGVAIHPSLPAADLQRARGWYADKLGLTPTVEIPGLNVYGSGPAMFTVYQTPSAGTAKNTAAVWVVEDLDAVVAHLRGRGVVFEDYDMDDLKTVDGIATDPDGSKAAWFTDSEGNILGLTQWPPSLTA